MKTYHPYVKRFKKKTNMNQVFLIALLVLSLGLGCCLLLAGCKPGVIEEIAEGITEGVIDQIEEYNEKKIDNKK